MNFTEIKCSCGAGAPASKKIVFDDGDYYLCENIQCKKQLELDLEKAEFRKSFQGKSKESYDLSMKLILGVGTIGWIVLILYGLWTLINQF